MSQTCTSAKELDFERIVIYPRDYDAKTRNRLKRLLDRLDIRYECGYWG